MSELKSLANKLIRMARADQEVRMSWLKNSSFKKSVKEIDKKNLSELKGVIKNYGWPTVPLVGSRASNAAWLLVQHADSDLEFQKHCLRNGLMSWIVLNKNILDIILYQSHGIGV